MSAAFDPSDLLPTGASLPFEIAIAKAAADDLPVPIRECLDPATTPVAFLPFLAVHRGTRLWFSDWSEARKRQVIAEAPATAALLGTRAGARRLLGYVDAGLVDVVAYPAPFVMGRARIGRTPIGHPAFLARYLVKVVTYKPPRALVMSRGALGRRPLKTPSREAFRRCLVALRAAKSPETEVRVDFSHMRPLLLSDGVLLDGSHRLGEFVTRAKL